MDQRNFSQREVAYVIRYGKLLRRTGICFYFLAGKDVPPADRKLGWVQRLIGVTVLMTPERAAIITLYKNQKALRDIKKKNKFRSTRTSTTQNICHMESKSCQIEWQSSQAA
ncbi:MAG: hypothetical protein BGO39_03430 [Chloroflexi bacterium 54-19]|nr:MAG: hypothetical protein BGO39_03430 [Chloroflexi bacterium 54-19]